MGRRLSYFAQLLAILWCSSSLAVGLGEIELDSALNQNFKANIPVTGTQGLAEYEVLVKLASGEDFERVGVERFFYLTNIQFSVQVTQNGGLQISLETSKPISEPYLNFLVEVRWPNGRLLKEFTVLLDPPTFTAKAAPSVTAPGRSDPGGGGRSQQSSTAQQTTTRPSSPIQTTRPTNSTRTPAQTNNSRPQVSSERFEQLTNRNDTLWKIASEVRPSNTVNVQQTMLALQRLNPKAFIQGNINLLKAGYKLTLPSESDILEVDRSEAAQRVAQHNTEWQAYRSGASAADLSNTGQVASGGAELRESDLAAQVDATSAADSVSDSTQPARASEGELKIVSGSGDQGGTTGGDSRSLSEAAEEVERISRENDELQYRLDRLSERETQASQQNDAKTQQIELQAQRLAEMQEQLKKAQSNSASSSTEDASFMDVLMSPIVLALGGLVLALAAGLMFVSARAKRAVNEAYELIPDEGLSTDSDATDFFGEDKTDPLLSDPFDSHSDDTETSSELDVDDVDDDENESDFSEAQEVEDEIEAAQTSDVVGEADIYIAYGRYPQALALLNTAIEADPSRAEVRLKLLEIYAETDDRAPFDEHMQVLIDTCEDEDKLFQARDIASEFGGDEAPILDGEEASEEDFSEEFSLEEGSSDAQPVDSDAESSLDFDLELDDDADKGIDFVLDEGGDESGGEAGDEKEAEDKHASAEISASSETSNDSDNDKLGGDLGIDFDPDVQLTEIRKLDDADASDEFDLDDLEFEGSEAKLNDLDAEQDDAFDFLDEQDVSSTKLDLARAYIDMGDEDGAREILSEVVGEGSEAQQSKANELLAQLSSP